jgi:mRNA-degrading endonuclease toxin of MazEF toxin-antitoxin module
VATQWTVLRIDFGVQIGHEMAFERPALVVSNDSYQILRMIVVCPFTGTDRDVGAHEIKLSPPVGGLTEESILMIHQVRSVSEDRVVDILGTIADPVIKREVREELESLFDFGIGMP